MGQYSTQVPYRHYCLNLPSLFVLTGHSPQLQRLNFFFLMPAFANLSHLSKIAFLLTFDTALFLFKKNILPVTTSV